jgi:hypothetical protein
LSRALSKEMIHDVTDHHGSPDNAEGRKDNNQIGGSHTRNSFSIPYIKIIYQRGLIVKEQNPNKIKGLAF